MTGHENSNLQTFSNKFKHCEDSTTKGNDDDKENRNYINIMRSDDNLGWKSQENNQFFPKKTDLKLNVHTKIFIPKHKKTEESLKEHSSLDSSRLSDSSHALDHLGDLQTNYSFFYKDRGKEEDDEKHNESLHSIQSEGTGSRKSTDISFKQKFKTEQCKYWELNKICKYGDNCAFAHGNTEMRQKVVPTSNYKTKKCRQFFENGYCPYGARCQFLHTDDDTKPFTYKNLLRNIEEKGESKIDASKRLKVFVKICTEKKQKKKHYEVSIYDEKSIYSQG